VIIKYLKFYAVSLNNEDGNYYCEVIDGKITRQINLFGEQSYWATPETERDPKYDFTDQASLSIREQNEGEEITREKFDELWNASILQDRDRPIQ
jgi:hypothetical protein